MKNLIELFKSYISLDERNKSLTMLVFAAFGVIGAWKFFKYGVSGIDSTYTTFMLGLAALILGVNAYMNKNGGV